MNKHSVLGTAIMATKRSWTIKVGFGITFFFVIMTIIGFFYLPYSPIITTGPAWAPPNLKHIFGTTNIGQDVFSQWIYGARSTMLVGGLAASISVGIGLSVGLASGYIRKADNVLMRITDVTLTMPALPLLITIAAFVTPGVLLVAILIAVLSWGGKARVVRSMAISLKNSPMVDIARMSGVPTRQIMFSDILKHTLPVILAYGLFTVISAILTEAALDFIGVGPITNYSWGAQISIANTSGAILAGAWWWFLVPGLSIAIFSLGLAMIAYGLETSFRATGAS